jgi:hypothetical protein
MDGRKDIQAFTYGNRVQVVALSGRRAGPPTVNAPKPDPRNSQVGLGHQVLTPGGVRTRPATHQVTGCPRANPTHLHPESLVVDLGLFVVLAVDFGLAVAPVVVLGAWVVVLGLLVAPLGLPRP